MSNQFKMDLKTSRMDLKFKNIRYQLKKHLMLFFISKNFKNTCLNPFTIFQIHFKLVLDIRAYCTASLSRMQNIEIERVFFFFRFFSFIFYQKFFRKYFLKFFRGMLNSTLDIDVLSPSFRPSPCVQICKHFCVIARQSSKTGSVILFMLIRKIKLKTIFASLD